MLTFNHWNKIQSRHLALMTLLLVSSATTLGGSLRSARAEPERTTTTRPFAIVFDSGFGSPNGLLGGAVSYHVTPAVELSAGGGLGFTGIQASVLARYTIPLGSSPTMSWFVGGGPSLGFRSQNLGFRIERATDDVTIAPDKLFYTAWLNVETGWVGRARWGGVLRFGVGAGLRVADNQRTLCDGAPETGGDCNAMHFGPGSIFARTPILPYLFMQYGWAF